jgi:hypothetical protein
MTNLLKHKMRGKSTGEVVGWVILGALGIGALAILFGFVIMWLWNWLMPEIFGLTTLTYWQAVGLFILSKILIGTGGGGGKGHKSKKHTKHKCKNHGHKKGYSKWEHYDNYWKEEGDKSYTAYVENIEGESTEDNTEVTE